MIIDKFVMESKKYENGEFKYIILPEKERDRNIKIEHYPRIYICTNDYYSDTYVGMMLYNIIKKKLPLIYFNL